MKLPITFELPLPPSINAYYRSAVVKKGSEARSKRVVTQEGRDFRATVARKLAGLFPEPIGNQVFVHVIWFEKSGRAADADNRKKALWDALTKAGVWKDDDLVQKFLVERVETDCAISERLARITIAEASKCSISIHYH